MKSRGKKLYEVFLFSKEVERIKNDNYSGSAALLDSLISALETFLENSDNLSPEDIAREIEINISGPVNKHSQLVVLHNFFDELETAVKKYSGGAAFREKLKDYLAVYTRKWNKVNDKIAANAMKAIEFRNKTVLLHSNSSTIHKVFEKLAAKNIFVNVIQCESRPVYEGRRQAKKLAALGFPVTLIVDSYVMNCKDKIDFALLGTDGISGNYFLNKIGSYFIALGMKEIKKPLYLLTDTRKITGSGAVKKNSNKSDNGFILPPEQQHSHAEIWSEKNENIKIENLYFEKVPLKLVTKTITEK
jgi:translation initiation factor eIF-2B subunit delta